LLHGSDDEKSVARKACPHLVMVNWTLTFWTGFQFRHYDTYTLFAPAIKSYSDLDLFYDVIQWSESDSELATLATWMSLDETVRKRPNTKCEWRVSGDVVFAENLPALTWAIERLIPSIR
jgi:hypothetical protein